MLLPLWIGLWTLIPLLVWLEDRGPVFFRQQRAGVGGRGFVVLKFRTMVPNADLQGPGWTTADDDRITRTGRILRKTALDELPEILSIWKGEMSLVGPRPYLAQHDYLFQCDYKAYRVRQFVKPGVTGPAQCRGLRGEFTDPELVRRRIQMLGAIFAFITRPFHDVLREVRFDVF